MRLNRYLDLASLIISNSSSVGLRTEYLVAEYINPQSNWTQANGILNNTRRAYHIHIPGVVKDLGRFN